ncbi:hypothetical protein BDV37DRAFT_257000 [Aspergillus pseudonomiae]|uniref:Uncharacterized protein n=1 Tax=Aspergillus pseudonomiae TaxID=1506151 RepID=A0A5N7D2V4_9EURO|nr:uncharacterized protein BDV37DRAFT_257000 [Aspergillus pseudonomiae]KAE8400740.1 hypothetical protein BDV37DRAFT_257000 [Aspergillus pseudonomiae]
MSCRNCSDILPVYRKFATCAQCRTRVGRTQRSVSTCGGLFLIVARGTSSLGPIDRLWRISIMGTSPGTRLRRSTFKSSHGVPRNGQAGSKIRLSTKA